MTMSACSRIPGGLVDAVVGGIQELPSVNLTELPRMADFARFAEAVGGKLGWPAGTAMSNCNDNRRDASMTAIGDSALAAFLLDLRPDYLNDWSGAPAELFEGSPCWRVRRPSRPSCPNRQSGFP
jgi:putative DNA primase/helicase